MGVATPIELTDDERETLATWVRRTTTEQRMVQRARIILEAAAELIPGKRVGYLPDFWEVYSAIKCGSGEVRIRTPLF